MFGCRHHAKDITFPINFYITRWEDFYSAPHSSALSISYQDSESAVTPFVVTVRDLTTPLPKVDIDRMYAANAVLSPWRKEHKNHFFGCFHIFVFISL
jgi:hypothetical protein